MNELLDYAGADGLISYIAAIIFFEIFRHAPIPGASRWLNMARTDDKTINSDYIYAQTI